MIDYELLDMEENKDKDAYVIHKLDLDTLKKALEEARAELKVLLAQNKELRASSDMDPALLGIAEDIAKLNIRQIEEKIYLMECGMPVYTAVDFYKEVS